MRSRTPLVVLVLAVLSLAVVLAFLYGGDGERADLDRRDLAGTRETAGGDPAAPRSDPDRPRDASGPTLAATAVEETQRASVLEGSTQTVKGAVRWPIGTPAEERTLVIAVARASSAERLYSDRGPADAAWEASQDDDLVAFAEVERDGRFALEVPADATVVHLALAGRYVYSLSSTAVALPQVGPTTLSGQLGAWITGRIHAPFGVDAAALDLVDEEIELGPDITGGFDAMRVGEVAYDLESLVSEDGRFEFRAVPCGIKHGVLFKPSKVAAYLEFGIETKPGERRVLDVYLQNGATISGRVVDEAGTGIAGVAVSVRFPGTLGRQFRSLRSAKSGENGEFRLEHVYAGEVELAGEKEGFRNASKRLQGKLDDGQSIAGVLLELTRGDSITGRVTFPDGEPAVDALVRASLDLSSLGPTGFAGIDPSDGGKTTTGADGSFVISGLGGTNFEVNAKLSGESEERAGEWRAKRAGVKAGGEPIELVLEELMSVAGRVVDGAGEPVVEFQVFGKLAGSGGMLGIGAERGEWGPGDEADGTFEADGLRAGDWELTVVAKGFAASQTRTVGVPTAEEQVFVLRPAASVSGLVLDPSGAPVSGAEVTLDLDLAARMQASVRGEASKASSDADGRFHLEGLDPGSVVLVASHPQTAASPPVSVEVFEGEETEGVVLTLRVGGTLTGVVLGKDGEPAEGRMITVQIVPNYARQHILTSDSAGEFRVEKLEPGSWQVVATANLLTGDVDTSGENGMASFLEGMEMDMVEIVDGEEVHVVLGKPAEDAIRVTGRVTHAHKPVPRAMVSFVPEGGGGMSALKMAFADEDGSYEVELEKRGPHLMTVQHMEAIGQQNSIEYQQDIPSGVAETRIDIELPLGRIAGRVLGPSGEPAGGCRITLHVDGGITYGSLIGANYVETVTGEDGRYELSYLRPGTYTVCAGGSSLGGLLGDEGALGRKIHSGIEVEEAGMVRGIDFELEKPGQLVGVVKSRDGKPVPGASVFIRDERGRLLERFSMVTTDASGRYTYKGLAPGSYTVLAKLDKQISAESDSVRVRTGEPVEAQVTLDLGTMLLVTVVDASEEAVGARISVVDDRGHEVSGMLTMDEIMSMMGGGFSSKEQRVGPLPPGTYTVTAVLDDGRTAKKKVDLDGQEERSLKLRAR